MKTPVGVFPQANVRADGTGKVWNFDLKAGGPGAGPNIEVRGGADLARDTVTVQKAVFNLDNIKAKNDTPLEIVLSPGLEVKPATFEINKGKVSVQARVTAQQAQGSFSIQNLQLESLVPKSFPLKGIRHCPGHPLRHRQPAGDSRRHPPGEPPVSRTLR